MSNDKDTKAEPKTDRHTKLMMILFTKLVTPVLNSFNIVADRDTEEIAEAIFHAVDKTIYKDSPIELQQLEQLKEDRDNWKSEAYEEQNRAARNHQLIVSLQAELERVTKERDELRDFVEKSLKSFLLLQDIPGMDLKSPIEEIEKLLLKTKKP